MGNQGTLLLVFIAVGIVMSIGFEIFGKKTRFAQEHHNITFFAGLTLFIIAAAAAIHVTQSSIAWIDLLIGFAIVSKIQEMRRERRISMEKSTAFEGKVATALGSRSGDEAIEIEVNEVPESAQWSVINDALKRGLKVESLKDLSTQKSRLRISGLAQDNH